jgi:hypothetical protein
MYGCEFSQIETDVLISIVYMNNEVKVKKLLFL